MANVLKVAVVHAIIGLLEQDWPYRRIARELGVDRETVARYDRLRQSADSKPANATPGSNITSFSQRMFSQATLGIMSQYFQTQAWFAMANNLTPFTGPKIGGGSTLS
jgi:hypothetical protein